MMRFRCNHHVATFDRDSAAGDKRYPISASGLNIPEGIYTFVFDYPLSKEAHFPHKITTEVSLIDILLHARSAYETIYALEDATAGKTANIPGMLNRASSSGTYGIWGHCISDLYFESVEVDPETKRITFGIGS